MTRVAPHHLRITTTVLLGLTVLGIASSAALAAPQRALRAFGPGPDNLTVQAQDLEDSGSTPDVLLTGARFLPIQASRATRSGELDPNQAGAIELFQGLPALRLPGDGRRFLLHYSRSGDTVFGFLLIGADGEAHILMESQGLGPAGSDDPFGSIIGVEAAGAALAITSTVTNQEQESDGDCWLFLLDGARPPSAGFELTGPGHQEVETSSLTFFGNWLYAVVEDNLARAPTDGSAGFAAVTIPGAGSGGEVDFIEELAVSPDGSSLALLAGDDEERLDVFLLDALSVPRRVTASPAEIEEPGYLPDQDSGPFFALSQDGRFVMYVMELGGEDELFLQSTGTDGAPPFQITADGLFHPSMNELTGVLGLENGDETASEAGGNNQLNSSAIPDQAGIDSPIGVFQFFVGVGEAGTGADLFQMTVLTSGRTELVNLTGSSGASGPYLGDPGAMNVLAAWRVGSCTLVVDDQTGSGGGYRLWSIDPRGSTWTAPELVAPPRLTTNGNPEATEWIGVIETALTTRVLRFAGISAEPETLLNLPRTALIGEFAQNTECTRLALSISLSSGLDYLVVLDLDSDQATFVSGSPFQNARNLLFASEDCLLFTVDTLAGATPLIAELPSGIAWEGGEAATHSFWLR